MGSEEDKKKQRKEKLKEEAEKLGISYKELKEQKKSAKEKKKRSREADGLTNTTQKDDAKRMRTWSHDENDPEQQDSKKRRTRSMDAKEEEKVKKDSSGSMSPEEWRKDQHITIKGHGKYNGQGAESFPRPFFKFTEAPFSAAILKSFDKEGFTSPTAIQSQVCEHFIKFIHAHTYICTYSNSFDEDETTCTPFFQHYLIDHTPL
jgi:hypothetical protein